ncbi:hypothetical protein, partial [Roseibium sp. RKSG952]|uniref:hypothetical protein n=1 Tax=Roseibium sp. RKSG952 TaxID=2529384 RepID=UPI0018AD1131
IKQVEILSALREALPDMPEIDPAHLGEMRTLAQIAAALQPSERNMPVMSVEPQAAAEQPSSVTAQSPVRHSAAAKETVLAIVAEKTGYPA